MYEISIKETAVRTIPDSTTFSKIADTGGDDGGTKYGYVTKPAHKKEVTTTIFTQTVDTINLLNVVAAINGVNFKS
jgi:hypothetical protein